MIDPTQSIEQKNLLPYRCLIDSDQLIRIYLDELPAASPDDFEMGILELISSKPDAALAKAKSMVPRLKSSNQSEQTHRAMLQFIETVILAQFPKRWRTEIEKMVFLSDLSETRVFQEALEQGREEGREQTVERIALEFLKLGRPVAEIAKATGLSPAKLRVLKKK